MSEPQLPYEAKRKVKSEITRAFVILSITTLVLFAIVVVLIVLVFVNGRNTTSRNRQIINLLCNRSYDLVPIADDVVSNLIAQAQENLADDIRTGRVAEARRETARLLRYQDDHLNLQDQLQTKGTPCAKTP